MRPSPLAFTAIIAGTVIVISGTLAIYAFHRSATTSDEIAQLWQARILLTGRLSLPPDPNPEFFALENVIDAGRWYSQFPIGGPAVLATGALFGVPWLVNPVLAAVAAAAMYSFARHAFGELQGRASAALFSVTSMVLFMAGTWMNHVSVLCLATIALAALAAWERASSSHRAMVFAGIVGLALGAMATIRPLDAIIVAVPVGLFQLWTIHRHWWRSRELAIQAAFGVVGVAPLLYANAATTGRPLRFGYEVMWGAGHQLGFRVDPYGNVHTVSRALEYAMTYVSELNMYLVAWPTPALLVVIVGLIVMRCATRRDALLLALLFAQVAAYASYSLVGEFLGPRFLYTALPALVILLARTPFLVGDRFGDRWRRAALTFTLACVVIAWCMPMLPYSVWGLANQVRGTRRGLKLDIAGTVRAADVHHAVVFLREPLGGRLLRRLWGVGMPRSEAARLLEGRDSCSLLSALRAAEMDSAMSRAARSKAIARAAAPFASGETAMRGGDPPIQISSPASLTPACRSELADDARLPGAPFGPALPLEPIGAGGRIDGDVIYVADLGERNDALRARFGDRTWYRLKTMQHDDGALQPLIVPY